MKRDTIIKILKNLADKMDLKEDTMFNYSVDKQKKYLVQFNEPKDKIERSYYQYCCQQKMKSCVVKIFTALFAYPLIIYFFLRYRREKSDIEQSQEGAVFLADGKPSNIIPNSLKEKYRQIQHVDEYSYQLLENDQKFILELSIRYPFSPLFILKNTIKVARYRDISQKYNPYSFIVCAEYSFTSSLLTEWCERNGYRHINVMHGEKPYYIRDAFFEYHECYVWHEYHKELFIRLRAEKNQFVIERPSSLIFSDKVSRKKEYDYIYYLADENEVVLKKIAKIINQLSEKGFKIAVRPHPRYSKTEKVKSIMENICDIEEPSKITIEESVLRTQNVVSLMSTVLTQAIYNQVPIIIDDISNPTRYEKLKKLEYFFMEYENKNIISNILK